MMHRIRPLFLSLLVVSLATAVGAVPRPGPHELWGTPAMTGVAQGGEIDEMADDIVDAITGAAEGRKLSIALFPLRFDIKSPRRDYGQVAFNEASAEILKKIHKKLGRAGLKVVRGRSLATRLEKWNRFAASFDGTAECAKEMATRAGFDLVLSGEFRLTDRDKMVRVNVHVESTSPLVVLAEPFDCRLTRAAWERESGQGFVNAAASKLGAWGSRPDATPDPKREFAMDVQTVAEEVAKRVRALDGVHRLVLIPNQPGRDAEGKDVRVVNALTDEVGRKVRTQLEDGEITVVRASDFDRVLYNDYNRTLDFIDHMRRHEPDLLKEAQQAETIKVSALAWLDVEHGADGFTVRLVVNDRGFTCGELGASELSRPRAIELSRQKRASLSVRTPDAEREIAFVARRATEALLEKKKLNAFLEQKKEKGGCTLSIGAIRGKQRTRKMVFLEEFGRALPLQEKTPDAPFKLLGVTYDDYACGLDAERLLWLDMLLDPKTSELGVRSTVSNFLNDALTGVEVAADQADVATSLREARRYLEYSRLGIPVKGDRKSFRLPDAMLNTVVAVTAEGPSLTILAIDTSGAVTLDRASQPVLPELQDAVFELIDPPSTEKGDKREPKPPVVDCSHGAAPRPVKVRDPEDYLSKRTCLVASFEPHSGKLRMLSHGSGFALKIGGKNMIVTNRHVVTRVVKDSQGRPQLKLVPETWVFFPQPDGTPACFRAKYRQFSMEADLAVLDDGRPEASGRPHFEVAESPELNETILLAGFPGAPTRERGSFRAALVDRPEQAFNSVSIYLTRGIFSGFGDAKRYRSVGRMVFSDVDSWKGNSGGPMLNRDFEVVGVLTFGLTGRVAKPGDQRDPSAGYVVDLTDVSYGPYLREHGEVLEGLVK